MRRLFFVPALLAVLAGVACGPTRAPLEVDWTFGGKNCADAGVASVRVQIAGEVLTPDTFTCGAGGSRVNTGASLGNYLAGTYDLTVSGYGPDGSLLYQTETNIRVQGGYNQIAVDAAPVAPATGSVTLKWTFNHQSCAAAGIATLHVSVDNQELLDGAGNGDLPCSQNGIDGISVSPLSPGAHSFDLVALDSGGATRYALNGFQVTVQAGQDTPAAPDLQPAAPTTASAQLFWKFSSATQANMTCAQAQVDTVRIYVDPAADGSGGTNAGDVPCTTNGTDGAAVEPLSPGVHSFAITGIRAGHAVFFTHHPPSARFDVGLITDINITAESP